MWKTADYQISSISARSTTVKNYHSHRELNLSEVSLCSNTQHGNEKCEVLILFMCHLLYYTYSWWHFYVSPPNVLCKSYFCWKIYTMAIFRIYLPHTVLCRMCIPVCRIYFNIHVECHLILEIGLVSKSVVPRPKHNEHYIEWKMCRCCFWSCLCPDILSWPEEMVCCIIQNLLNYWYILLKFHPKTSSYSFLHSMPIWILWTIWNL